MANINYNCRIMGWGWFPGQWSCPPESLGSRYLLTDIKGFQYLYNWLEITVLLTWLKDQISLNYIAFHECQNSPSQFGSPTLHLRSRHFYRNPKYFLLLKNLKPATSELLKDSSINSSLGSWSQKILTGEWDSEKGNGKRMEGRQWKLYCWAVILWATGVSFGNGILRDEKLGIYPVTPMGSLRAHFPALRQKDHV